MKKRGQKEVHSGSGVDVDNQESQESWESLHIGSPVPLFSLTDSDVMMIG